MTPHQFEIAYEGGTERPFQNAFWDNKRKGVYASIASGAYLFSSKDKFDSGTGWPSFTKPLAGAPIEEIVDKSHGMVRTEVRCSKDGVHLGHVFRDGPDVRTGGRRYCINSASLKFID